MTKLPTSPDALRRLADAIEKRDKVTSYVAGLGGAPPNVYWDSSSTGAILARAFTEAIREHFGLLVTAALADFDKEVLLAHAAVQDSMEET